MCLGSKQKEAPAPPPPAETLQQAAPVKKTPGSGSSEGGVELTDNSATSTKSTPASSTNPLAIGTKKYRNTSGLGSSGLTIGGSPSGIPLAR